MPGASRRSSSADDDPGRQRTGRGSRNARVRRRSALRKPVRRPHGPLHHRTAWGAVSVKSWNARSCTITTKGVFSEDGGTKFVPNTMSHEARSSTRGKPKVSCSSDQTRGQHDALLRHAQTLEKGVSGLRRSTGNARTTRGTRCRARRREGSGTGSRHTYRCQIGDVASYGS